MHNDSEVHEKSEKRKPEIVMKYNATKGSSGYVRSNGALIFHQEKVKKVANGILLQYS